MPKTIIVEGKTTSEALEKGLKELNVNKDMVEVKQIEDKEKRSFYSILAPRVVKLELTVKEEIKKEKTNQKNERKTIKATENIEDLKKAEQKIKEFLDKFLPKELNYETKIENSIVFVNINGEHINHLIGYRGESLKALQTIISTIARKELEAKVRVFLDIGEYKKRRATVLEELAEKVSKTVIRTRRSITLEPMEAYERKIIHTKLQENDKIKTYSIGEEPHRRLVVSLK